MRTFTADAFQSVDMHIYEYEYNKHCEGSVYFMLGQQMQTFAPRRLTININYNYRKNLIIIRSRV